jgi:hypothetical protein
MSGLVDRHELRVALEREERICKRVLGRNEPLATSFFEIVYRTLNKAPTVTVTEPTGDEDRATRILRYLLNGGPKTYFYMQIDDHSLLIDSTYFAVGFEDGDFEYLRSLVVE